MEFSQVLISSLKKGNSTRSSSPINRTKIVKIINDWHEKNKRLHCACSEAEFEKMVLFYFDAFEGTLGNQYALQSGGGPSFILLLDLIALLLFITCLIYTKIQSEEANKIINKNIGTINEEIDTFHSSHNLTIAIPYVNRTDVVNQSNYSSSLLKYTKASMTQYLSIKREDITKECEKPVSFIDSIPNLEYFVSKYIPLPRTITHKLLTANAKKEREFQQQKNTEEYECYMMALQQVEQTLTAQMDELILNITSKLNVSNEKTEEEIKLYMYTNVNMTIAFAYLATRFAFRKKGKGPPANPLAVVAVMKQNISPFSGIENISPPASPTRSAFMVEDISPPRSRSRSPPRSRTTRKSLPSQKFLWLSSPDNPLNQGGARRKTHRHNKHKRSISKSKRKTRKHR